MSRSERVEPSARKLSRVALFTLFILLYVLTARGELAAQTLRPGRLSKEETAALVPGLRLEFISAANIKTRDVRISRVAALYSSAGAPPTPFLSNGAHEVTLSGYLKVPLKGSHTFYVHGTGPFTLSINGSVVLARSGDRTVDKEVTDVPLVKGYNAVTLQTSLAPDKACAIRVDWSGPDFVREPLPADALFTRGDEPALAAGLRQRGGRELFATHNCLSCHTLGDRVMTASLTAMPELAFVAPSLKGIGSRLNSTWLEAWILDPKGMRSTATMPHVLKGDLAAQRQAAADITAYLTSLAGEDSPEPEITQKQIGAGVKLFEDLGCVGCHSLKPVGEEDLYGRRSLHFVKAKYTPGQLVSFLKAPQKHYAWSRMPDFRLTDDEALALAAFVLDRAQGELEMAAGAPAGDVGRGKMLFTSSGCNACHQLDGPGDNKKLALETARSAHGCLATPADDKSPEFGFTADQVAALQAFLAFELKEGTASSLMHETPAEFAQRQVTTLNCVACHRRDGASSVLNSVLQDESEQGLTPEVLPLLTWTGEKLKPEWTEKLLAGQFDQRARPWLRARMPAFPARAKLLALGLSYEHGFAADENPVPAPDGELAKVGQQLVGDNDGFSCIKCHAIGKRPALQPFEAPGINLVSAAERLRYSYYPRWMMDPPRVDVLTKMPKFAADGKTTGVTAVFEGDAARQYEALWHYIQTLSAAEGK